MSKRKGLTVSAVALTGAIGMVGLITAGPAQALDIPKFDYSQGWGYFKDRGNLPQADGWLVAVKAPIAPIGITYGAAHSPVIPGERETDEYKPDIDIGIAGVIDVKSPYFKLAHDDAKGTASYQGTVGQLDLTVPAGLANVRFTASGLDYSLKAEPGKNMQAKHNILNAKLQQKNASGEWETKNELGVGFPVNVGIPNVIEGVYAEVVYTDKKGRPTANNAPSENGYFNAFRASALGGIAGEITCCHGAVIAGEKPTDIPVPMAGGAAAAAAALGLAGAAFAIQRKRRASGAQGGTTTAAQ
ncbi:hypothetical protein ACTVZO_43900 [Streptomyces sp. IBSNAI002]|uniref:hypothetical protein n=1 Tax=Streptomyces sp. IBSNAI002 TaxID=3457500 RepID=UPI003FD4A815